MLMNAAPVSRSCIRELPEPLPSPLELLLALLPLSVLPGASLADLLVSSDAV
jgi:hypothetical protein